MKMYDATIRDCLNNVLNKDEDNEQIDDCKIS